MTALTLRFSSICVMACKIIQRGVNITQLKHQLTVGYTTTRHHEKGFVFIHRGEYKSLSHDVIFSKTTTGKPFDGQPRREHIPVMHQS